VASIQPAHLLLGFVFLAALRDRKVRPDAAVWRLTGPAFWLLCTWIYGIAGAYFLPRFFAGRLMVNSVSAVQFAEIQGLVQTPLLPTNGNITQSIYFTGDVVCFLLFCAFASDPRRYVILTKIFVAYCAANIFFALLDIATAQTGTSDALEFMRNSTYVIYVDTTVGDMKWIIGSFTEASAFAYATIGALCFSLRLWLGGVYARVTLPIAIASLILLLFSTSSTGYVALGPCLAMIFGGAVLRILRGSSSKNDVVLVLFTPPLLVALAAAVALNQDLMNAIRDMLNTLIFEKSLSQSGMDRTRFNVEGYQTFLDSFGLGTGIGSVRASSFIVAILSNLGIVGSLCYVIFIALCLWGVSPAETPYVRAVRGAARCFCCGLLIAGTISGALIDLGLPFFAMAALSFANPFAALAKRPVPLPSQGAWIGRDLAFARPPLER
jgi:hypothetical protein